MTPAALEALATAVRTLLIWVLADRWAVGRYRRDQLLSTGSSATSEPVETSSRREAQRNGPLRFAGRWVLASIAVLLSGTRFYARISSQEVVPVTIVFGLAIAVAAGLLMMGEVFATRWLKVSARVFGWLLAIGATLGMAAMDGGGAGELFFVFFQYLLIHPTPWILLSAALFLAFPAGDWIGRFMSRWTQSTKPEQGLPEGGKWIGRLERLLILACLLAGQPAGIAILVTAKGAFRFGEIRNEQDNDYQRKMIEYILIGSMLSYAVALTTSWLVVSLVEFLPPLMR